MFEAPGTKSRSVLISGASIAGPALAYWLDRYSFDVTVVERGSTVRSGGYPIDVRGTAIDVVERMGLLPRVQEAAELMFRAYPEHIAPLAMRWTGAGERYARVG